MIELLSLTNPITVEQILSLQKASYLEEAKLINFYEIPPLMETKSKLMQCGETFYGYYQGDRLAGFLAFQYTNQLLDIYRLAVHPDYFRMGIADKLLEFVLKLYPDSRKAVVCTGQKNLPAVNLYQKHGFHKKREVLIENSLYITEFEKNIII